MKKDYIYYKRDAGKYFTREEFIRFIHRKVQKTIQKYNLLRYDDVIAVAVSGGKDSVALLYVLDYIERKYNTEIVIIHVDEGISGYSEYSLPIIKKHAKRLGYRIYSADIKSHFGYSIDDVGALYLKGLLDLEPCSFCGEWRRWLLNYLALKAGATVVATAHTLDDFAQTVLMNVMRNSLERLLRLNYSRTSGLPGLIPRIYPFMELYEKETALYANLMDLEYNDAPCPYAEYSMRWDLRIFLYDQENKHPGLLYNILRFHQSLIPLKAKQEVKLNRCKICGYPTPHQICRAHYLAQLVKEKTKTLTNA